MMNLKNKQILFFAPAFFGYEYKIKEKMENLGAKVDFFDERSITKSWQKALLKINPNIFYKITEKYYMKILEEVKHKKYNYVFFIKCDMPTENVLKVYKNTFKTAKFCLYLYDSMKNIPYIKNKLIYFDLSSSFDRMDCKNNETLKFRPLFYCDEYKKTDITDYKYDLCFIGTIHSDRYKILKIIQEQVEKEKLHMYIYPFLQSKFIYYFYKLTKKEFRDTKITDFKFDKISSNDIANIVKNSKIIVDIQHPKQTGLTMRTIEMLGMNKKIITTNEDIVNYDFYNKENIVVFKRNELNMKFSNLNIDYIPIDNAIYEKYSLENWIMDVLKK